MILQQETNILFLSGHRWTHNFLKNQYHYKPHFSLRYFSSQNVKNKLSFILRTLTFLHFCIVCLTLKKSILIILLICCPTYLKMCCFYFLSHYQLSDALLNIYLPHSDFLTNCYLENVIIKVC